MEIAEIVVDTTQAVRLPWQETIVIPWGDFQYGAQGCATDRIKRTAEWGMKNNAYFLGMGEYLDIASPSNRRKMQEAGLYDSVKEALEDIVRQREEEFLSGVYFAGLFHLLPD